MKRIYVYLPFFLIFLFQSIQAQISFTNRNDLFSNTDFHSGVAIAVTDMNNDGKDDVIRMNQGYELNIEFQNPNNQMFTNMNIGNIDNGSQWSMCIADVDNNGFNEIFAGGAYDDVKLVMANNDGTAYTTTLLTDPSIFVQGSNFADINNDGYVDLFACHDDAESHIWGNDGAGNLDLQDDWIDMATTPTSDDSGNYGSIWTDFDNDGDIDLYIAKCRQGISNMDDPRRINALFVNDGNGNYTEQAEEYGLKVGWQSWTSDFQDVNNDGHLDCFITNHDHEAQLMINDGTGHFYEAQNTGIQVDGLPVQGVMRDFDNDGFVDILVAGTQQHLFKNNGDLTFTEVSGIFDSNNLESYALGDLNGDGFVDIYGGYADVYTSPSDIDDVLWMNDGNDNNHLTVKLEGVQSNKNAVGSRIEIYGDWGIQIREVRSGESYGIMNSMIQYFGLGTATEVDSIKVRWTSGLVNTEYDVNANSNLLIVESGCIAAAPILDVVGNPVFCPGDALTINAPAGYATYLWSTGETTSSINVASQGSYKVTVSDGNGCFGFSTSVNTINAPTLNPEIAAQGTVVFCEGESVILSEVAVPNAASYTWSNGDTGVSATISESGTYQVVVEGACENFTSNSITVEVLMASEPTAVGDTVAMGEQAELVGIGDDLAWYDMQTGGTAIGYGNNFMTPVINASTTFYIENRLIIQGLVGEVGKEEHTGGSLYSGNQFTNNTLIFDALQSFMLDSVKVYTDLPGARKVLLMDNLGMEIASKFIEVYEGENILHLGLEIPAGENMYLTTDFQTNFDNLGQGGPRLQRSGEDVNYPYEISDYVSIKGSNQGPNWYYYFYDWKISTPDIRCESERVPVEVLLDTDVVAIIDFGKNQDVHVFPNPTTGEVALELNFDFLEKVQMRVMDVNGKVILENEIQDPISKLNFEELPKGIYMMQVIHGSEVYSGKIVLQ